MHSGDVPLSKYLLTKEEMIAREFPGYGLSAGFRVFIRVFVCFFFFSLHLFLRVDLDSALSAFSSLEASFTVPFMRPLVN